MKKILKIILSMCLLISCSLFFACSDKPKDKSDDIFGIYKFDYIITTIDNVEYTYRVGDTNEGITLTENWINIELKENREFGYLFKGVKFSGEWEKIEEGYVATVSLGGSLTTLNFTINGDTIILIMSDDIDSPKVFLKKK